jgi:hypothetical protein
MPSLSGGDPPDHTTDRWEWVIAVGMYLKRVADASFRSAGFLRLPSLFGSVIRFTF